MYLSKQNIYFFLHYYKNIHVYILRYKESIRRYDDLAKMNVSFVGLGVSGGMEGARNGASLMAGCDKHVFDVIAPILGPISAQVINNMLR